MQIIETLIRNVVVTDAPPTTQLRDLFPESIRVAMDWTFETMAIAERYADRPKAKAVSLPFKALEPSGALNATRSTRLYTAHALELRERALRGSDLRPATAAELVSIMSKTSLDAPLTPTGCAVYAAAFLEAFSRGNLVESDMLDDLHDLVAREQYPGELQEELEALRRKYSVKSRKV